MSFHRHLRLPVLALALAVQAAAHAAYPDRAVTMVVPFPPGAGTDITARALGAELQKRLGQTIVIVNKAGAGGMIAGDFVKNAQPDGYTLLFGAIAPLAIAPNLYKKPAYDPLKDFTSIGSVAYVTSVLMVNTKAPYKSVKELFDKARSAPAPMTYGSFGNGSTAHVGAVELTRQAGVQMTHIPYKGSAPASLALQAGEIDMMFENMPSAVRNVQAGRVRAIAVSSAERSKLMPEVPTLREAGFDFEMRAWYGVVAPAGLPADIAKRLNAEINAALNAPDFKQSLEAQGAEPFPGTMEGFKDYVAQENQRWRKVILQAGAQVD